MEGGNENSALLDDVISRLSGGTVDWAQQQADQFLRSSSSPLAKNARASNVSKVSNIDYLKSQRQRSTKSKRKRDWDWYIQLNPPQPLSNEEHIELAKVIEVGLFAEERLEKSPYGFLTTIETRELRHLAIQGKRAFAKLVKHNLRLVFNWARPFREIVPADELQDAFQAGVMGLIRGLEGWDYKLGFTLSTYVTNNIRQSIQRWRSNETLVIRVPVHVWTQLSASGYLKRVSEDEDDLIDGDDDDQEETLDPQEEQFEQNAGFQAAIRSLNLESICDVSRGVIDEYSDLDFDDFQSYLTTRNLSYVLDALPQRSAGIIRMRYGFYGEAPATLDAIGELLGVTRERIRQIVETTEAQIAIIFLMRQYPTVRDVIEEFGYSIGNEEFWEWLDNAFSEMFPLPRNSKKHFSTLANLMGKFPRHVTDVAQ